MASRVLRTKRRRFSKPESGAIFSPDEIPLLADVPPIVVAQAIASGELKTFRLDGVTLIDGPALCEWIDRLDTRVAAAIGKAA